MAHPVYSFIDPKTKRRFYQVWDTFWGHAYTVPMNFLTFLQFNGLHNQEFIRVTYMFYDRILVQGASMQNDSFDDFSEAFKHQAYDYVAQEIDSPNDEEQHLINQLEHLFAQSLGYYEVWNLYQDIVAYVNPKTKRPRMYYLSWSETMNFDEVFSQKIEKFIRSYSIILPPLTEYQTIKSQHSIDYWFSNNLTHMHFDAFLDCFIEMIDEGLIALVDTPHILRLSRSIIQRFLDQGLQEYLPSYDVKYNLFTTNKFSWEQIEFDSPSYHIDTPISEKPIEMLQLSFNWGDKTESLFVSMEAPEDEDKLIERIKSRLNVLLYNNIDITNPLICPIELYKALINSNYINQFFACKLNFFILDVCSNKFETSYFQGFRNNHFESNGIHELPQLRQPQRNHALILKTNQGAHYSFFKCIVSALTFKSDCESFVNQYPQLDEEKLINLFEDFIKYLNAKHYKSIPYLTISLDTTSLETLLGVLVNSNGKFNPPLKDPDELPF